MDKQQFKTFCKKEFYAHGFKKQKNTFYLIGHDLLCGIELQKSNYGPTYYVNVFYCIGDYSKVTKLPVGYDNDVFTRIPVMSKTQTTIDGEHYITAMIEYEEYSEEELKPYFDKEFEETILPPVYQGKKVILENLWNPYSLTLHQEEVMQKLQS